MVDRAGAQLAFARVGRSREASRIARSRVYPARNPGGAEGSRGGWGGSGIPARCRIWDAAAAGEKSPGPPPARAARISQFADPRQLAANHSRVDPEPHSSGRFAALSLDSLSE